MKLTAETQRKIAADLPRRRALEEAILELGAVLGAGREGGGQ